MKDPLYITVAAIALLVTLMLPVLSSTLALSGERARSQPTTHLLVARRGTDAMCQSGFLCGG
jgi:hypothetical protein